MRVAKYHAAFQSACIPLAKNMKTSSSGVLWVTLIVSGSVMAILGPFAARMFAKWTVHSSSSWTVQAAIISTDTFCKRGSLTLMSERSLKARKPGTDSRKPDPSRCHHAADGWPRYLGKFKNTAIVNECVLKMELHEQFVSMQNRRYFLHFTSLLCFWT